MSDAINDAGNNEQLKDILGGYSKELLIPLVSTLNLSDYSQGTWKSTKQNLKDLLRARANIVKAKKRSGHHSNDTATYLNKTMLTVRKGVVMPEEAVYYIDYRCEEHPAIDQDFTEVLKMSHKSESNAAPESDEDEELR